MLNIRQAYNVGAITPNFGISNSRRNSIKKPADRVELRSLERFFSESVIKKMLSNNPKIRSFVMKFNPEMKLNMEELRELQYGHAKDTQNIVRSIVDNLPYSMQAAIDKKHLDEAAYLHDLGKVLIPKEVLNKPGKLTPDERKIMDTHSIIGFELLKNSGLSEKTLNLIKHHHKRLTELDKMFKRQSDYALQVLSTADKYSALLENRVYKKSMIPQEALSIIYRDVENGELDMRIFMALAKHAQSSSENLNKTVT